MTLANYLRTLRDNTFTYPVLGAKVVKTAQREQILAWLKERKQAPGKNLTTENLCKQLLAFEKKIKPFTQREIAHRGGVSVLLVNKAFTSGKKIRGINLRKILSGMGIAPDSNEGKKALTLWASETGIEIEAADVESLVSEKSKALSTWWRKCVPHLQKMTPEQREDIALAISRPSVVAALPALNAVYSGKK